jgi:hypothetical protein
MGLAKALALLNLWHRERVGGVLYANDDDVDSAMSLYSEVSECQDYGLSPYVYDIYRKIVVPLYQDAPPIPGYGAPVRGITRQQIIRRHRESVGSVLTDPKLRQEILPALEEAGLIEQVEHPTDSRKLLVKPLAQMDTKEEVLE